MHALRDEGPLVSPTRWKPRLVWCGRDAGGAHEAGERYVVKYLQGQQGAAALISEVVCRALLEAGGIRVLEAALVYVSPELSASYARKSDPDYDVQPGYHFGTVLRTDVHPGPPTSINQLAVPQESVDIWVFDSWFMNTDRPNFGNLLMAPSGGKWHLIPADQSDCFGGAATFASGRLADVARRRGAADGGPWLEQAILRSGGVQGIRIALEKASRASRCVSAALHQVPDDWWREARLQASQVGACLEERARRLHQIVDLKKWRGLSDAIRGGRVLDI